MASFTLLVSLLLAALVGAAPAPVASPAPAADDHTFLGVPIMNGDAREIIPNKYIVVYNDTFDDDAVAAHQAHWVTTIAKRNLNKRSTLDNRWLSTTVNTFGIGTLRAMALDADDRSAIEINDASEVAYIEADAYVHLNALVQQSPTTSGLARLSAQQPGANAYVFDDTAGQGITAFVVDTGIMAEHSDFEGRATMGFNGVNNNNTDENGHVSRT